MADDPSRPSFPSDPSGSVADSTSSDPNIIPAPEPASVPADRPVSTILADSPLISATPSADLATDYTAPATIPADSPVATESANISSSPAPISTDAVEATSSAQPAESPPQSSADLAPSSPMSPASPPSPPEEPLAPPPQSVPQEASTPSPEPAEGGSISVSSPSSEPSQVQPVVSESASISQVPDEASQSAEIKPEHLEGTQNAPLADSQAPASPKTSFGDLVGQQPTITIEPIEPPKPVQPPQSTLPFVASAKEGISPLSPQPEIITVVEAKANFSSKRQQALQVRRKKREDYLAKIITLVDQKGKVSNKDVRDALRVSQSTTSDYLHTLVKSGKIKKEGKAKATIYLL